MIESVNNWWIHNWIGKINDYWAEWNERNKRRMVEKNCSIIAVSYVNWCKFKMFSDNDSITFHIRIIKKIVQLSDLWS